LIKQEEWFVGRKGSGALRWVSSAILCIASAALMGCGGSVSVLPLQADVSHIGDDSFVPGSTPFMGSVRLQGEGIRNLAGYSFTIQPEPGAVSAPVHVTYTTKALYNRGYVQTDPVTGIPQSLTLPIYGLYAGFTNNVSIDLVFSDGSEREMPLEITTQPYDDPTGIYAYPIVLKQRSPVDRIGFSFFAMKSIIETPVIVDTDGQVRWVGTGVANSMASILAGDDFLIGNMQSPSLYHLTLPGVLTHTPLESSVVTGFHHNIDPGKQGFLVEVHTATDYGSTLEEISAGGTVLRTWDLAEILKAQMEEAGDDPTTFVRRGSDWFHMNAAAYDSRDNSVIVSSRENFLIKLDYNTGKIIWIFGDPTKYWHTFPSLRAKALTLEEGGLYPIGQHAVSMTSDGLMMVFNDGFASVNQPTGTPTGETRTYSAVSAYSIDAISLTAEEIWNFDYGQSIFSALCSSAYEAPDRTYLVDYAMPGGITARLVGLDSERNVVFDFQYPTRGCNTSWNAVPIPLDTLTITR
jgi:arylsulfate sulfotransferase